MTIWRKRALVGASTAALLIALVPLGREVGHELDALKRVTEFELAMTRLGESRLAHMLPLPSPEPGWSDAKRPDPQFAERGVDTGPTGSLGPGGLPEAPSAAPTPPDPATLAMPAPPAAATSAAVAAYGRGDSAALAALAKVATDPDERLGLEW